MRWSRGWMRKAVAGKEWLGMMREKDRQDIGEERSLKHIIMYSKVSNLTHSHLLIY